MTEVTPGPGRARGGRDAAALSLIDIRRVDREAVKGAKAGDLTAKLKQPIKAPAPAVPEFITPALEPALEAEPIYASPATPATAMPAPEAAAVVTAPTVAAPELALFPPPEAPPAPTEPPVQCEAPVQSEAPPIQCEAPVESEAPVLSEAPPNAEAPPLAVFTPEPTPCFGRRTVPPAQVYVSSAPLPPRLEASAPPPTPVEKPPYESAEDLIDYWDDLRGGRELPLLAALDRTRIAISWPDTMMVNYAPDEAAIPQIVRLSRLTGVVEFSSMVTEWILSCSRQVARLGKAMETRRAFSGARSTHQYRMLLLPFADATGACDHILCHLSCAD